MSIKKTGIALWHGSGFLLRTLKKKSDVFCQSLFFSYAYFSAGHVVVFQSFLLMIILCEMHIPLLHVPSFAL